MPGACIGEMSGFRIEHRQKHSGEARDEIALRECDGICVSQGLIRQTGVVGECTDCAPNCDSEGGSLHTLAGHIAYQDRGSPILRLEDVVEITANGRAFSPGDETGCQRVTWSCVHLRREKRLLQLAMLLQ